MPVSGIQSGHQIVQMSQQMAEKAAHGINDNLSKVKEEIASHNIDLAKVADVAITASTPSLPSQKVESLINLTQAAGYNRVGASVIEKNNEVIGSLLDIHI
ncbi:hypothetical protein [Vibrio diabolicus]|uniref:hypothetical protein n=1 Tax=Vibrio diabolicus TaxID=50719 RepID=UPI00211A72AB|nr:hypothetical protein [Vibrio diabolicus]